MHFLVNMLIALNVFVFFPSLVTAAEIKDKYIDGDINSSKVLELVYGSPVINPGYKEFVLWKKIVVPQELKKYFHLGEEKDVFVYKAFEAMYSEQGKHKYILVTQAKPSRFYECHACAPLIGIIVFNRTFKKKQRGWTLESENKYADVCGKWGTTEYEEIKLVNIGKDKHGILFTGDDVHQGIIDKDAKLFASFNNNIKKVFQVHIAGPGAGYCDDEAAKNSQDIELFFQKRRGEYYDIQALLSYNQGKCGDVKPVKETKLYFFKNGKYVIK